MNNAAATTQSPTPYLDSLVCQFTAARDYSELARSMRKGYVPTLSQRAEKLASTLEDLGWKVFRPGY